MSFKGEGDRYNDLWGHPELFEQRQGEVIQQLDLIGIRQGKFTSILEVGSGFGGETSALKILFPRAKILAIDRDDRAAVSARLNKTDFKRVDLLTMFTKDFSRSLKNRQVDLILALRSSPEVIDYLLTNTTQGLVVASMIRDSDQLSFENLMSRYGQAISLEERRGWNEFAWVKDFG